MEEQISEQARDDGGAEKPVEILKRLYEYRRIASGSSPKHIRATYRIIVT